MIANIQAPTTVVEQHDDQSDGSADVTAPTVAPAVVPAAAVAATANPPVSLTKEDWLQFAPSLIASTHSVLTTCLHTLSVSDEVHASILQALTTDSVGENLTFTTQTQHAKSS